MLEYVYTNPLSLSGSVFGKLIFWCVCYWYWESETHIHTVYIQINQNEMDSSLCVYVDRTPGDTTQMYPIL